MKQLLIIGAVAAALLMACGGSSTGGAGGVNSVLHLDGFDISPDNYRAYARAKVIGSPLGPMMCVSLEGVTVEDLEDAVRTSEHETPSPDVLEAAKAFGATLVLGQTADFESDLKSAEILLDECRKADF